MPASSDHKLSFYFGWMKWVVLGHGEGLMRDAVHIEGHTWDFHIEDKVVPILITDLVQLPVELRRPVLLLLRRVLTEEEMSLHPWT